MATTSIDQRDVRDELEVAVTEEDLRMGGWSDTDIAVAKRLQTNDECDDVSVELIDRVTTDFLSFHQRKQEKREEERREKLQQVRAGLMAKMKAIP